MRRVAILAIALAATCGSALARSPVQGFFQPEAGRYAPEGGAYDHARVLRVDPVIDGGRGYPDGYPDQRCYTREDRYTGPYGDGFDGYGDDGYVGEAHGRDAYGRDTYGRDAYGPDGYGDRHVRNDEGARMVATVVGGVVGAVLGSRVGGGSGRYATSAIGSMVGGMAGREIYEASQRDRIDRQGRVTVCDPVPDRYGGDRYAGAGYGGVRQYDVTYEYAGRRYTTRTDYHPGDTIRVRVDVRPD